MTLGGISRDDIEVLAGSSRSGGQGCGGQTDSAEHVTRSRNWVAGTRENVEGWGVKDSRRLPFSELKRCQSEEGTGLEPGRMGLGFSTLLTSKTDAFRNHTE